MINKYSHCVIVIFLISVILITSGCGGTANNQLPSITTPPNNSILNTSTTQASTSINSINSSAFDTAKMVYDPQLTDLQRQEVWSQYVGKQIQWTASFVNAEQQTGGLTAIFVIEPPDSIYSDTNNNLIVISVLFDNSQKTELLKLKQGDFVTFTGILKDYMQSIHEPRINLINGKIKNLAMQLVWSYGSTKNGWNTTPDKIKMILSDGILFVGGRNIDCNEKVFALDSKSGAVKWKTEKNYMLGAIDANNAYLWHSDLNSEIRAGGLQINSSSEIVVLNKVSGNVITQWSVKRTDASLNKYVEEPPFELLESVLKAKTIELSAKDSNSLIFTTDRKYVTKVKVVDNNITYLTGGSNWDRLPAWLRAIDSKNSVLWTLLLSNYDVNLKDRLWGPGIQDFVVENGILYINLGAEEIRAYSLLAK